MNQQRDVRYYYFILALGVFIWALALPICKIGLEYINPIWFTAFSFIIATVSCFLVLLIRQKLRWPKRRDLPMILIIGLLQMAVSPMLANTGLSSVGAGRAGILAYSTPLWVTPIAVLFFGEKITLTKLLGIILGLIGIFILFSPTQLDWNNTNILYGSTLLILAAIIWAIAIVQSRFGHWHSEPSALLPWQLLLASVITTSSAILYPSNIQIEWNITLCSSLLYNGVLSNGFGYWASINVFKNIPAITSTVSYLCVPIFALILSAILLHEKLDSALLLSVAFILSGVLCVHLVQKSTATPVTSQE